MCKKDDRPPHQEVFNCKQKSRFIFKNLTFKKSLKLFITELDLLYHKPAENLLIPPPGNHPPPVDSPNQIFTPPPPHQRLIPPPLNNNFHVITQ